MKCNDTGLHVMVVFSLGRLLQISGELAASISVLFVAFVAKLLGLSSKTWCHLNPWCLFCLWVEFGDCNL